MMLDCWKNIREALSDVEEELSALMKPAASGKTKNNKDKKKSK